MFSIRIILHEQVLYSYTHSNLMIAWYFICLTLIVNQSGGEVFAKRLGISAVLPSPQNDIYAKRGE